RCCRSCSCLLCRRGTAFCPACGIRLRRYRRPQRFPKIDESYRVGIARATSIFHAFISDPSLGIYGGFCRIHPLELPLLKPPPIKAQSPTIKGWHHLRRPFLSNQLNNALSSSVLRLAKAAHDRIFWPKFLV